MSSTYRLLKIDKTEALNEIRKAKASEYKKQIEESEDGYLDFRELISNVSFHNELNIGEPPFNLNLCEPFYYDENVQEMFFEDPRVLQKNDMEYLIKCLQKFIADYYKSMLKKAPEEIIASVQDKVNLWDGKYSPYHLGKEEMTNCYDAEYIIWDWISFYNSINWNTQFVIMYMY